MIHLTGTGTLIRLALRRDRIILPAWIVALSAIMAGIVASVVGLYANEAERVAAATFGAANVVSRVFDGPASGTEVGAMVTVESFGFLSILVALMSTQAVVRHTRLEEETGRAELVGSAVVGRHARSAAAIVVALGANLVLGGLVAAVLLGNGLAVTGSLLVAAALAGVGAVFTGVAAVTAQIFSTARGANGAAGAAVGVAFALRAIGDALGEVADSGVVLISAWPSWLSPIGWGQQVRAFHEDHVALLGLFVVVAAVLLVVAGFLTSHRDVGAGVVQPRPGPAEASPALGTPLGLAWRLQRGILVGWATGLVLLGISFGAVGDSADELVGISSEFEQAIRATAGDAELIELFFGFLTGFLAIAATGYTVQALLRMRGEEAQGRLEPVLSTAIGRWRWLASHLAIAVAGTIGLLVLMGASGALSYGLLTGDWGTAVAGMLGGTLSQVPAVLAVGGFVVAVFGLVPRWASAAAWSALGAVFAVGQLGALLDLPQAVQNVSPFTHLPPVPAEPFALLPTLVLLAVAVVLTAVGGSGFRRRDLVTAG